MKLTMASDSKFRRPGRQHALDNFRSFLTVSVMFMHTAIAYGGPGQWMYRSRFHGKSPVLIVTNAVLSSFTLGGFFFVSGYLSSRAAERKSRYDFITDKFIRLGIPTVVYTVFVAPIPQIIIQLFLSPDGSDATWQSVYRIYVDQLKNTRGVRGPPWYCATLLVFDASFVFIWRPLFGSKKLRRPVSNSQVTFGIIIVIFTSFLLRLRYPLSYRWPPLHLLTGHVPQWIGTYILGHAVSSPRDITHIFSRLWFRLLCTSLLSTAATLYFLGMSLTGYSLNMYAGGWNPVAATYEVWNEVTGLFMLAGLFSVFDKSLNFKWGGTGRYSYGAFLLHPPICVAIMVILNDWKIGGVAKTLAVTAIGAVASWMASWLLVSIPGVGRVI
jgi:glucans biosynthesis protein C